MTLTPEADLIPCSECGGINTRASVAAKIDCSTCDTTGYENKYTLIPANVSYRSGAIKQWDQVAGSVAYVGECSIKLPYRYHEFLKSTKWIELRDTKWNFTVMREPGEALGQKRIVMALSRKE